MAPPWRGYIAHCINPFPSERIGDVIDPHVVEDDGLVFAFLDAASTEHVGLLVGARERVATARTGLAGALRIFFGLEPSHLAGLGFFAGGCHGCCCFRSLLPLAMFTADVLRSKRCG